MAASLAQCLSTFREAVSGRPGESTQGCHRDGEWGRCSLPCWPFYHLCHESFNQITGMLGFTIVSCGHRTKCDFAIHLKHLKKVTKVFVKHPDFYTLFIGLHLSPLVRNLAVMVDSTMDMWPNALTAWPHARDELRKMHSTNTDIILVLSFAGETCLKRSHFLLVCFVLPFHKVFNSNALRISWLVGQHFTKLILCMYNESLHYVPSDGFMGYYTDYYIVLYNSKSLVPPKICYMTDLKTQCDLFRWNWIRTSV